LINLHCLFNFCRFSPLNFLWLPYLFYLSQNNHRNIVLW